MAYSFNKNNSAIFEPNGLNDLADDRPFGETQDRPTTQKRKVETEPFAWSKAKTGPEKPKPNAILPASKNPWLDPNTTAQEEIISPYDAATWEDVKPVKDDVLFFDDIINGVANAWDWFTGGQEKRDAEAKQATTDELTNRSYKTLTLTQNDIDRLGLDQSYLGLPYSLGYYNSDGKWVETRDLTQIATQMQEIRSMEAPENIDLVNSSPYQAIEALAQGQASGDFYRQDREDATGAFEQRMGLGEGGFAGAMGDMGGELDQGIMGQRGMTEEQQRAYNRETQFEVQAMRDEATQMLEALSSAGRNVAGYQYMLSQSKNVGSWMGQRHQAMLDRDEMIKKSEYEALKDRYDRLFDMEQVSATQYTQALAQDRLASVASYAQNITAMYQQNSQDRELYALKMQTKWQNVLNELGVDAELLRQSSAEFEQSLAPTIAKYNLESQAAAQAAADAEAKMKPFTTALEMITRVIGIFTGGGGLPNSLGGTGSTPGG